MVLSSRDLDIEGVKNPIKSMSEFHDIDISKYSGKQRRDKILRNMVDYEAGKTIFERAVQIIQNKPAKQTGLFA